MVAKIKAETEYDLSLMREDREWLRDFLIGCGPTDARKRLQVAKIVAVFLNKILRLRDSILQTPSTEPLNALR